jgi:hypothetical protein
VLAHEICHKYLELFGLFSKVDRQKDWDKGRIVHHIYGVRFVNAEWI